MYPIGSRCPTMSFACESRTHQHGFHNGTSPEVAYDSGLVYDSRGVLAEKVANTREDDLCGKCRKDESGQLGEDGDADAPQKTFDGVGEVE